MSDARSILRLYDHARLHALPVVLATVTRTAGSTYRKTGARMMLCADGSRVGVVSGGCLEGDVTRRAWFLKKAGEAEIVCYDTGSGDDATYEFGLGCRGVVELLVERLTLDTEPEVIRLLRRSVERRVSGVLSVDLAGLPRFGARVFGNVESIYEETIAPPAQLIVFGSGADMPPLVKIANELGWSTLVVDHKLSASRERDGVRYLAEPAGRWSRDVVIDARTACVLMTHRMMDDAAYLADLVGLRPGYVGCLGPASRTEALLDELALAGIALGDAERQMIRAPVGLDLGAERPQEIALSIVAEVAAAMSGGSGSSLSTKQGPIHAAASQFTSTAR